MLPETCVVVPTYWTRAGGESHPDDALYDHPTRVDTPGTLGALLDSLAMLDASSFYLLVLVAVTGPDVVEAAENQVLRLLDEHPNIRSVLFGSAGLAQLREWLTRRGLPHDGFLDLCEYPKIRNLQLAVPLSLGSQKIVALDDDEIVVDKDFLRKATSPLGSAIDGLTVDGLSGHYLQEDGSVLLRVDSQRAASPNLFDRKAAIMNAATEAVERQTGSVVPTPFCFGGNMEFTADLAASVGFDPGITRGEDIDYLINARMEGRNFFLRKDLNILHRPPSGGSYQDASMTKLQQDVIRFVYEREKLLMSQQHPALHPVNASDLMPYPGEFLTDGLDHHAQRALDAAGYTGDSAEYVRSIRESVPARLDRYLEFRRHWPRVMAALRDDQSFGTALLSDAPTA